MDEKKISNDFMNLENKSFKQIEAILKNYDYDNFDAICCFVSSIFGVNRADMLSKNKNGELTDARYMFWYALNYMTHKTYGDIAKCCVIDGGNVQPCTVSAGITAIREKIDKNPYLCGKWLMIKKMIHLKEKPNDYTTSSDRAKRVKSLAENIIKEVSD